MLKKILFLLLFPVIVYGNEALESDIQLANIGNSGAAFRVGLRYLDGNGVEKDYEKAKYYLKIAGDKNHANALYNLGYMYLYGIGVDKDYMIAYDYFEKSKNQGFTPAYFIIGLMYYDGAGVKQSHKKAYEYCKTAIDKGYKTENIILDHRNRRIVIKSDNE